MKKTVLITGGTSSLGEALIEEFYNKGLNVIFTYNSNVKKAKKIKSQYKNNLLGIKLNLQNEKSIKNLANKIDSIDILINNAAYNYDCNLMDKSKLEFEKTISTNLIGPFILIKSLIPKLKKSSGNIINIASTNGINTMYSESLDYDASKAALINLTKNLASTLAPIRVNAVAPGWIETEKTKDMNPKYKERELQKIALKRFANPSEIAKLVYFISSEDASYITGSIIEIDGGKKYEL